ncbi:MAG TPA: type II toxin-antitoxin system PemK/MazF family toxin [Candidatus Limnocylindria bacterium]|nr:type II toxin-antitoxin system PemK/MazF family toxin [Candidatus Limnocylindria bacterium]
MTIPARGEIWSVRIPGQPDDPHQPRPALVVSADVRNRMADDVMVIPIFSKGAVGPTHVPIDAGAGGLRKSGVLFCEELTTVDRDFLSRGPLGPVVSRDLLMAVVRGVRRALGETVAEPS